MIKLNLIGQLYNDIENSFDIKKDGYWKSIIEEIKKEKDKDPNKEYTSIKKAIKIYLNASNDYNNEFFTRMCEIQDELERFYGELVSRFIKDNSELSDVRVEKMLRNLRIHYDLYSEIVEYLLAGNIYKKKLIEVEGYNVKELCSKYNLSIVGAYNYLIYLREDPRNALADLKKMNRKIIKRERGILVIKQFGKTYLRFMAGGISDKLYQVEISQEELDLVLNSSVTCELIINKHMNANPNMPDELVDRIIIDYLNFNTNYSDERKKSILDKLHKYGDIFNEFYYFVLREIYEDGVVEAGYCASELVDKFHLNPLGAYNYLIYLREEPEKALAKLKAGLPRK